MFAAIWLFYLLSPLSAAWDRNDLRGVIGIVATLLFAAVYLAVFVRMRWRRFGAPFRPPLRASQGVGIVLLEIGLAVVMCLAIGQKGDAAAVYIAVTCVMCLQTRWAWLASVTVAVTTYAATVWVPSWHRDEGILFGTLVATLAIWGISQSINRNIEMLAVREENARLALGDERNRFARDLHAILGHSLTAISIKSGLAARLAGQDPSAAVAQMTEVEQIARVALADVRATTTGLREVRLATELASARSVLPAAGVEAITPSAVPPMSAADSELLGYVVREAVTNVVRHAEATRCTIVVEERAVTITDDGVGLRRSRGSGSGLVGLRRRLAQARGKLTVSAGGAGGTIVRGELGPGRQSATASRTAPTDAPIADTVAGMTR